MKVLLDYKAEQVPCAHG